MARPFSLSLVLLALFVSACASKPRRPTPQGDCASFCKDIKACAAKAHHPGLGGVLCRTALCETGHKCQPDLDSPDGRYRGAFQFLPSTWERDCVPYFRDSGARECLGDSAMHDLCCATRCAASIVAKRGSGDWPTCGRRRALHRTAAIPP